MKGTTNAQQNAVVGSSSDGKGKLTLNYADGTHPDTQIVTVDEALSTTSTNPVQNKVVKAAIDGKQAALSSDQMSAVNSGVTSAKITKYDGYEATINSKLDSTTASNTYATKTDLNNAVTAKVSISGPFANTGAISNPQVNVIYLVSNGGSGGNIYDEYIYTSNAFEKIGTTATDLSSYYTKTEADGKYALKTTTVNSKPLSGNVTLTAADVGALASGGTAVAATKATQDGSGNVITSTYVAKSSVEATSMTDDSSKIPSSKAVLNAINSKMDAKAIDSTPTENSTNLVTSGGVYSAINNLSLGGGGGGGATEDASLWIPSNYDLTEISLGTASGSGWSMFHCSTEDFLAADVLVVKYGYVYTIQDLTHYKIATNESEGFSFTMVVANRNAMKMSYAFLTFSSGMISSEVDYPLAIYYPCSNVATNFGFTTISTDNNNSPSLSVTKIDNFTIYLGTKKTSSGGGDSDT